MPEITISIPNPRQVIPALKVMVDTAGDVAASSESFEIIDQFIAALETATGEAEERAQFDAAWAAFATSYIFEGRIEEAQQRNGFTEGWARARRAASLPTQYPTTTVERITEGDSRG